MVDISKLKYPDAGSFRIWHERELYLGRVGDPLQLPNEGDIVITVDTGMKVVEDVDLTTGTFRWGHYNPFGVLVTDPRREQEDPESISVRLLGSGHGVPADAARVYLDTSVWPYTLAMPSTLYSSNPSVTYYRVFEGIDYSENSLSCISDYYNASNQRIGDRIPMYRNTVEAHDSVYLYCGTGNCRKKLKDNAVVTVVFYSDKARVVEVRHMLVINTDVAKRSEASSDSIIDIRLVSQHIKEGDLHTILMPQGSTVRSLGIQCLVRYRSGKSIAYPIDDDKVRLLGHDAFISNIPNSIHRLTLSYRLDETEINDTTLSLTGNDRLVAPYTARIISVEDDLLTKLHVLPRWVSLSEGYRLEAALMNMGRSLNEIVTEYVSISGFDPTLYDVEQRVVIQMTLSDVSVVFPPTLQSYIVYITLRMPDRDVTPWEIRYELGQESYLGTDRKILLEREPDGTWTYDLSLGFAGSDAWVNHLYWPSKPLYDAERETDAPTPNRFRVYIGDSVTDRPISEFNTTLTLAQRLADYGTAHVEFYRLSGSNELRLSIVPVMAVEKQPIA